MFVSWVDNMLTLSLYALLFRVIDCCNCVFATWYPRIDLDKRNGLSSFLPESLYLVRNLKNM
jgi:hypothetical protein